ncbi:MAG TPA: M14 family zinc carboxypeptidase [Candidatus Sumerlaeota bacterium]|nr:M14 family zinc carboxypeptidase [Candidatus Sumerlaeota bacterium]
MSVDRAYWFTDFEHLADKLHELAAHSSRPCEIFNIGVTHRGRKIPAIRIGQGKLHNPAIVAGNHGHEVAGLYACLAMIDTLLNDASPTGENVEGWADAILERCTVHFIPFLNVDNGVRYRELIPTCDYSDRYSRDAEDWQRYIEEFNEPRYYFEKKGVHVPMYGFTPEQVEEWKATGKPLGIRYNDQGIDLFCDYKTFFAPETRAARDYLISQMPCAVLELHNHEPASQVFVPVVGATTNDGLVQLSYGEEMMTRLAERGLPCSQHSVRTYNRYYSQEYLQFPEFVYQRITKLSLFAQINTGYLNDYYRDMLRREPLFRRDGDMKTLTRAQRIQTGWSWIHTFLDFGVQRGFK